jgi:hypothetical protein
MERTAGVTVLPDARMCMSIVAMALLVAKLVLRVAHPQ